MKTPILFLIFNRPETTRQVFAAIRKEQPAKLYVAADGPRPGRIGEHELCEEVRSIATTVDWPCEIITLFRDNNLGCKHAVSQAISWFFKHEEEGIILEDDCLPAQTWFPFAEELLTKYQDDERIMNISAQHFHRDAHTPPHSYFFSRYFHCWGWATWRRAWKLYDLEMNLWSAVRDTHWLRAKGDGSRLFAEYWKRIFDAVYAGTIDTWDYQWTFSCWAQNGLTILPSKNLVTNIGFGDGSTHTRSGNKVIKNLPREKMAFPLSHPNYMIRDVAADKWIERHVLGIREQIAFKSILRKLPGVSSLAQTLRSLRGSS